MTSGFLVVFYLGDRVAIMSLGALECVGSPQFLKRHYGSGYKLILDPIVKGNVEQTLTASQLEALTAYIANGVPGSTQLAKDANLDGQLIYILPFANIKYFGDFFLSLEQNLERLRVASFGVALPSLEDVFLTVGADHSVRPRSSVKIGGIGSERRHQANFSSQVIGNYL